MSEISVIREHDDTAGWSYTVRVATGATESLHTLKLSWVDHDHWTHGSASPSATARAVVRIALTHSGNTPLPEHLDAGAVARAVPSMPALVREMLAEPGD